MKMDCSDIFLPTHKWVQGHQLGGREEKLKMAGTAVQGKPYLLCTYVTHGKGWGFGHLDFLENSQ